MKLRMLLPIAALYCLSLISLAIGNATSTGFVHPGISHTQAELAFVKSKIKDQAQPWQEAWERMRSSKDADLSGHPRPVAHVERGAYNRPDIGGSFFMRDAAAAYTHALLWTFTDNDAHANKAAEILNAWSSTLESVSNHDAKLLVGMGGLQFCNAAELLKHTWNGWSQKDQQAFRLMLQKVLYPVIQDFFPAANGNWDASMIQTMMAMGIFLDDHAMFQKAVDYYLNGVGNGAVNHYFYDSGQCQESGRDQGHTQMGLEYLVNSAEIAWKQGVDLYSAYGNRLAAGFEYTAKYNLGNDVPFTYYESYQGKYKHQTISEKSRGRLRPMYDKIVNHFHNRMGMDMPWCQKAIEKNRPESGGTMPWSTLMYADQPAGLVTLIQANLTAEGQRPENGLGKDPVDWVDPLIDTHESRWFYFNSASRPFGMVNLSPDTQTKGSWKSGYLYGDKSIRCFSHIHAWQLSGIPVMPIVGEMTGHQGMDVYQSNYSHDDEIVKAGYHKVYLQKYGITAELTSTVRTGFHRYSYPETQDAYVLFDLCALLGHGPTLRAEVQRVSDTEIAGISLMKATGRRRKDTPVFFVAQFSQAMTEFGGWEQGKVKKGIHALQGRDVGAFVRFQSKGTPVLMKIGVSYTSVEGARRNLEAECAHWDFDRVVRESTDDWNAHLARISVEGGSDAQKTKFYTDLWRSLLGRRVVSDVDGAYSDMTGEERVVRKVPLDGSGNPTFNMHNFDAWWGSHWSLDILWPLLCPERVSDFCNTSVTMYKNGGLIPRGPSGGNYTFVMIGDSAAPFITSAYAKGIRDFDCETALEGLVKNTGPDGGRYYGGYATKPSPSVYQEYQEKGYVSWGNSLSGGHGKAVTSLTLYNAYHDWCIAQMAQGLGQKAIQKKFEAGTQNYRHVIWPEKQSAWVRMSDGSWMPNFLPREETFEQKGFCETSAAVTTFYVPHDPMGLADMLGGPEAAAKKLNEQFEAAVKDRFHLRGRTHGNAWVDYANQDGTGAAHYFNRIGYPWLSQKWVRAVQKETFGGTDPYSGYNGDEDQGQMASLSALMTIGLFQFDGGSGLDSCYDITAPVFDRVTLKLNMKYYPGKTFTIIAHNQDPANIYIQAARWNGQPLLTSRLAHKDLIQGGTLELDLGPEPNKQWGHSNSSEGQEEQRADEKRAARATVVCFGDSITKRGYPDIVGQLLDVKTVMAGVAGNSTAQALRRMSKDVLALEPDVVVIFFGTNDMRVDAAKVHVPVDKYAANLEQIINACTEQRARVVLCTLPPINQDAYFTRHKKASFDEAGGLTKLIADYRAAAMRVAAAHKIPLVDLNQLLLQNPEWMHRDGVHPSPAGNAIIAKHIAEAVEPLLGNDSDVDD